jgi:hypothetical protein
MSAEPGEVLGRPRKYSVLFTAIPSALDAKIQHGTPVTKPGQPSCLATNKHTTSEITPLAGGTVEAFPRESSSGVSKLGILYFVKIFVIHFTGDSGVQVTNIQQRGS